MFSEGNTAHPVGCDSPLLTIMSVWHTSKKKMRQTAITICRGLSHPTRSLNRIACRGQEGLKGSKGTFRPDFQANSSPRILGPLNVYKFGLGCK
jgi:hypothetical protein